MPLCSFYTPHPFFIFHFSFYYVVELRLQALRAHLPAAVAGVGEAVEQAEKGDPGFDVRFLAPALADGNQEGDGTQDVFPLVIHHHPAATQQFHTRGKAFRINITVFQGDEVTDVIDYRHFFKIVLFILFSNYI